MIAYTDTVGHEGIEVEDNAVAAISFRSGALGVVQGSTAVWPGFIKRIEVSGLEGSAILEEENLAFWKFRQETPADDDIRRAFAGATSSGGAHPIRRPLAIMVTASSSRTSSTRSKRGGKPLVDGEEAMKAVSLIEAIYRSAETKRPVAPGTR